MTATIENKNQTCDVETACSACPMSGSCSLFAKERTEEKAETRVITKNKMPKRFFIKKPGINKIQKFSWIMVPLISLGGLWYHKLGLIMAVMMVFILGLSYFRGRLWCGNFCPRGAFLDYLIKPISLYGKIQGIFTSKYFQFLVVTVFMTVFTIRTKAAFSAWSTMEALDRWGLVFAVLCLVTTIIAIVLGVLFSPRTWCSFCPMGTLQKVIYSLNKKLNNKKAIKA